MTISYADASAIRRDIAGLIRPPRRISVAECAAEAVKVVSSSGAQPWDAATTPYMVEPMNLFASRRYEAVIFAGPARSGKTEGLCDCAISYAVTCDPGDMLAYFATELNAQDYSKRRLRRLHEHSEQLSAQVSPRAHDNNIMSTIYRNGMLLSLGYPTSSQMAQRDARYVVLSDYDSMPDDVDGEGSAFDLGRKRVQTMLSAGMAMVESSPKRTITDAAWRPLGHEAPPCDGGILPLYNLGDRRMYYWRCLHCREWFRVPALPAYQDRGDIDASAATAHVVCDRCGSIHGAESKRALNLGGRWVPDGCTIAGDGRLEGTPPRTTFASFWLLGCAAAFQPWHSIVRNCLRAEQSYASTGAEEPLRTTLNVDQGLPYLPRSMRGSRSSLALQERAEDWPVRTVPDAVRFLVAAIDVQGYRFVVQVVGWGPGDERWLIDRYQIDQSSRLDGDGRPLRLDPASYPEDWTLIEERVIRSEYQMSCGDRLMPVVAVCDSGGKAGVTERAYGYWRMLRAKGLQHRFALAKGNSAAKTGSPLVQESWPDSPRKDRRAKARGDVPVYLINTNDIKDKLDGDLKRDAPGPGYIHIPAWIDEHVFRELTAETRGPKGWAQGRSANEAWDLMVYDRAAIKIMELWQRRPFTWDNPPVWASDDSRNPYRKAMGQETEQPKQQRISPPTRAARPGQGGWVRSWRP